MDRDFDGDCNGDFEGEIKRYVEGSFWNRILLGIWMGVGVLFFRRRGNPDADFDGDFDADGDWDLDVFYVKS